MPEHKRDPSGRGPARLQCTAPWTPCGTDPACLGGAGGSPQPQAASGPFRPQPGVPMSVLRPHLRLPEAPRGPQHQRAPGSGQGTAPPPATPNSVTADRGALGLRVRDTVCPCHHRARAVQLSAAGRGRPQPGEAGGVQGLSRGHRSHLPAVAREPGPRSATVSGRRRPKCTVSPVRSQPPPPPSPRLSPHVPRLSSSSDAGFAVGDTVFPWSRTHLRRRPLRRLVTSRASHRPDPAAPCPAARPPPPEVLSAGARPIQDPGP